MPLFSTKPQAQQPKSPQAIYRDLLQQKRQLEQVNPVNEKQEKYIKARIQCTESLIYSYKKILGLKTPK